jgi:hypothetical protein
MKPFIHSPASPSMASMYDVVVIGLGTAARSEEKS